VIELDRRARRAAVALILRVGGSEQVELLLIKRATWEGDPWSGQIALPGGRHEGGETLVQTAVREAREETAIDLARDGVILGPLDDVQPHSVVLPRLVITPFVGAVGGVGEVTQSEEVAEAFWMPVNALRAPGAAREVILELAGGPRRMPSFQYRGYTIWGLTERILEQFLALTTDE
jgi:8-oxo-dGTP pyrophosphatase MutT (NUDIX family)